MHDFRAQVDFDPQEANPDMAPHPHNTMDQALMLALSTVQGGEAVLLRSFLLGSNSGRLRASYAQEANPGLASQTTAHLSHNLPFGLFATP